jgi:putative ABC transport system substrate-binding protein
MAAFSLASGASPKTVRIVAVLKTRDIHAYNQAVEGCRKEMARRGVRAEFRMRILPAFESPGEDDVFAGRIREWQPDLVLAVGTRAARFSIDRFEGIPTVFTMVLDSVQSGLTSDYGVTRGHFTGTILSIPVERQFQKILDLLPGTGTIGMLYSAGEREERVKEIRDIAEKMGLRLVAAPIREMSDLPSAIRTVMKNADVLWAEVDPMIYSNPRTVQNILLATFKYKKPFMAFSSSFVEAGALFAMENDYLKVGERTAEQCVSILNGEDPGRIPVALLRTHDLVLNQNTARFLGIDIPFSIRNEASKIFGRD